MDVDEFLESLIVKPDLTRKELGEALIVVIEELQSEQGLREGREGPSEFLDARLLKRFVFKLADCWPVGGKDLSV